MSTPNEGPGSDYLVNISCFSSTSCLAIGFRFVVNGDLSIDMIGNVALSWNGTDWSLIADPTQISFDANSTVDCTTTSACLVPGPGAADFWDGARWTGIPGTPQTTPPSGLTCVGGRSCVSVGSDGSGHTLVKLWDGSAWSTVTSGDASTGQDSLLSVSCAVTACFAVGDTTNGASPTNTLVLTGKALLAITTTTLPNGSVWSKQNRVRYSSTVAASGGNPPYKWSLVPTFGPLPPGLRLTPRGTIVGKATAAGTFTFVVQATDKMTRATKTMPSTQESAFGALSITVSS